MSKRILAVFMGMCALCLCACTNNIAKEYKQESYIVFENNALGELTFIGATVYIGDVEVATLTSRENMENAEHTTIEEKQVNLRIHKNDIPDGSDLSIFAMKVSAKDTSGKTYESDMIQFPLTFGQDYFFGIDIENGFITIDPIPW